MCRWSAPPRLRIFTPLPGFIIFVYYPLPMNARKTFIICAFFVSGLFILWAVFFKWTGAWFFFLIVPPLIVMGIQNMVQPRQSVKRNFPVIGRLRYFFEMIRPEIQQYFVESDVDGAPINRNDRSVIYQRAKRQIDTTPFAHHINTYAEA